MFPHFLFVSASLALPLSLPSVTATLLQRSKSSYTDPPQRNWRGYRARGGAEGCAPSITHAGRRRLPSVSLLSLLPSSLFSLLPSASNDLKKNRARRGTGGCFVMYNPLPLFPLLLPFSFSLSLLPLPPPSLLLTSARAPVRRGAGCRCTPLSPSSLSFLSLSLSLSLLLPLSSSLPLLLFPPYRSEDFQFGLHLKRFDEDIKHGVALEGVLFADLAKNIDVHPSPPLSPSFPLPPSPLSSLLTAARASNSGSISNDFTRISSTACR